MDLPVPTLRRLLRYFCFIGSRIGVLDSDWTECVQS